MQFPLRTVLVDNSRKFLAQVAQHLAADSRLEIVGRAYSGREALDQVARLAPDLVVTDVSMPDMSGLDLTRRLKTASNAPYVIIMTLQDELAYRAAAAAAGADGFVGKQDFAAHWQTVFDALLARP